VSVSQDWCLRFVVPVISISARTRDGSRKPANLKLTAESDCRKAPFRVRLPLGDPERQQAQAGALQQHELLQGHFLARPPALPDQIQREHPPSRVPQLKIDWNAGHRDPGLAGEPPLLQLFGHLLDERVCKIARNY
jgi:hypothetical protein